MPVTVPEIKCAAINAEFAAVAVNPAKSGTVAIFPNGLVRRIWGLAVLGLPCVKTFPQRLSVKLSMTLSDGVGDG